VEGKQREKRTDRVWKCEVGCNARWIVEGERRGESREERSEGVEACVEEDEG